MAQKPSIPKGTRDFSPSEIAKRNYISDIIKNHFETFGYQPIETPSFENSDTLMGKYGDEGDRLIFKILNSGEYLESFTFTLLGFFIEYFQLVIEKFVQAKIWDYGKFLEDFKLNKNSKEFLETLSQKRFSGEKIKSFIDEDFYDSAGSVQKNRKQDIVNIVKYHRNLGAFKGFSKGEEELIDKFAVEALGNYFIRTTHNKTSKQFSEKALRYDLTVPFARYVVMHQNELDFPFKRYQIQPVWRADRPQKGRFREFFQCDADVVGSDSLLQEVELIQLYDAVFKDLKLEGVTIKLNNRKILSGIAEVIGAKHLLVDFTVALDKLDKIGEEGVKKEMLSKGISEAAIQKASPLFSMDGSNTDQLLILENMLEHSEEGSKGVEELRFILETITSLGIQSAKLTIDVTLARGLNYYTGAIFEVAAPEGVSMGSIGGGGRYDDLTGIFGLKDVSGVGISFGLDRIYLVLEELGLFPESVDKSLDVLCLNFGQKEGLAALKLTTVLRKSGIRADLYPSDAKIQKQFKYANNRNVPYVVLLGAEELEQQSFVVKNMASGEQKKYALNAVEDFAASL